MVEMKTMTRKLQLRIIHISAKIAFDLSEAKQSCVAKNRFAKQKHGLKVQ